MIPYASLLGYKRGEEGTIVIDETQAPTVRLIYNLFLAGKSIREIAGCLEAGHHASTAGLAEIDRLIAEASAKHTALLAAFDELAAQPVQAFTPTQWTALIDHAIVGVEGIAFTFRDGRDITVRL